MRMSLGGVQRMGIAPEEVSGTLYIMGVAYPYTNGALKFGGELYAVSDDKDFLISSKNIPIGAIINGNLVSISDLTPTQMAFYQNKYKY